MYIIRTQQTDAQKVFHKIQEFLDMAPKAQSIKLKVDKI